MGDSADASTFTAQLSSPEGLSGAWDAFRAGGVIRCSRDEAPVALAVDAAANAYRFVCTRCGCASPWFESGPNGMRVREPSGLLGGTLADD